MKNLTRFSVIYSVLIFVVLGISTLHVIQSFQMRDVLKQLDQNRIQEQDRQFSEVLPIGVPISVRISDGQEIKIGTVGKTEIAVKTYRHAILRWENSEGSFISVIHEKDLQTVNPEWFKAFVSANGGLITLNNQECSPPYRIHSWQPEEIRN